MGVENEKAIIPLLDVNGETHSDGTKGTKLRRALAKRDPAPPEIQFGNRCDHKFLSKRSDRLRLCLVENVKIKKCRFT